MRIKTAVILAAGRGSRFKKFTEDKPKGFVEVKGKPMIIRSIETLLACGIKRIIIGTGYLAEKYDELKAIYPQVETCFSPKHAETNSMVTLYNLRNLLKDGEDFLMLDSDIIFDKKCVELMLDTKYENCILTAEVVKFQDQWYIEYDENNIITRCSTDKTDMNVGGEWVGITRWTSKFYQKMCALVGSTLEQRPKIGYEVGLFETTDAEMPIYACKAENVVWYEIDDEKDLEYVEKHVEI